MKTEYKEPEMNIKLFCAENIVTTSNVLKNKLKERGVKVSTGAYKEVDENSLFVY